MVGTDCSREPRNRTLSDPTTWDLSERLDGRDGVEIFGGRARLGRTAKGLTALIDKLYQRRINLVSLRDGIDFSTTAGRMLANVLASVAQFETEVRADRVAAGQLQHVPAESPGAARRRVG